MVLSSAESSKDREDTAALLVETSTDYKNK